MAISAAYNVIEIEAGRPVGGYKKMMVELSKIILAFFPPDKCDKTQVTPYGQERINVAAHFLDNPEH